ncbi:hypothetical protein BDEG_22717 [Batrachochytrium dendrobatidis JEL423]|uniref:Uncharacterized protein n=1 Tax=Batrachochytrium dendrobatidis (strain JEL423) TaxID=403673 RepID=A0A177WFL0_BATDL|nr:hypothetical protein BDEG_22717 [Batrachochytrium dendrobatidis JEL423]
MSSGHIAHTTTITGNIDRRLSSQSISTVASNKSTNAQIHNSASAMYTTTTCVYEYRLFIVQNSLEYYWQLFQYLEIRVVCNNEYDGIYNSDLDVQCMTECVRHSSS